MEPDGIDLMMAEASRVSSVALDDVKMDAVAHEALEEVLTLGREQDLATSLVDRPPRKVRRGVVAGILAAALAGTTGAVATGWIPAHTGVEADGSKEMGSGEMIAMDGSDLDEVVDRLSRGIPFPSTASLDRTKQIIRQPDTVMSTEALRSVLAFNAACEWTSSWLDAFHAGDPSGMSTAQAVLDEIPSWSSISGGGMGKLLELRAKGARLGDPSLFQREYDINCSGGSGSASSHGGE
jgi:hypothetical protein